MIQILHVYKEKKNPELLDQKGRRNMFSLKTNKWEWIDIYICLYLLIRSELVIYSKDKEIITKKRKMSSQIDNYVYKEEKKKNKSQIAML
jgi:hypothetical protein